MTARSGGGGRGGGRVRGDDAWLKQHALVKQQLDDKYGGDWNWNSRTYKWEDPETEKKLDAAQAKKWQEYQTIVQKKEQTKRDYWDSKWNRGPLGAIQDKINNLTNEIQNFSFDINYDEWELPTPQDLLADIEEFYQDSDVDSFLEDTQGTGELMLDVVKTIVTGKPEGKVEDAQNELTNTQTTIQETGENIQTGLDDLEDVVTDTVGTTNEVLTDIGTNVAEQFSEAMGLTDETQGGAVTEGTRGGDVVRDEDLIQLGKKKSDLRAKKKRGKKGLRIDYGVSLPGSGKSGIAA
tara:strand:+ start:12446 stop:13327 length:882 start_codon:yes stop_codon:yes gene_type:complete